MARRIAAASLASATAALKAARTLPASKIDCAGQINLSGADNGWVGVVKDLQTSTTEAARCGFQNDSLVVADRGNRKPAFIQPVRQKAEDARCALYPLG